MDSREPDDRIPRIIFNRILVRLVVLLARHGVVPLALPLVDSQIAQKVEEHLFGWFGELAPSPAQLRKCRVPTNITPRQLVSLTFECAAIIVEELPADPGHTHDAYYDESLNAIRTTIAELLVVMGYTMPQYPSYTVWICYREWEEHARRCGMDEAKIVQCRAATELRSPDEFEV